MSFPFHRSLPGRERLILTAFWTLWVLAVFLTAYALAVESFGIGLFIPDQHVPKLHMRAEARVACVLSGTAVFGMLGISLFVSAPSRSLKAAVFFAFAFCLFYLAIPRF